MSWVGFRLPFELGAILAICAGSVGGIFLCCGVGVRLIGFQAAFGGMGSLKINLAHFQAALNGVRSQAAHPTGAVIIWRGWLDWVVWRRAVATPFAAA